jgi:hypothetical protein
MDRKHLWDHTQHRLVHNNPKDLKHIPHIRSSRFLEFAQHTGMELLNSKVENSEEKDYLQVNLL